MSSGNYLVQRDWPERNTLSQPKQYGHYSTLAAWLCGRNSWRDILSQTLDRAGQGPLVGAQVRLLLVVEGANDFEFLLRLSARLRRDRPAVPDLRLLSASGRIVILPAGGGDPALWAQRLVPLGLPQYHLYDREQEPQTTARQQTIAQINARPGCHAALLAKRSQENYLHPAAIDAAGGGQLDFGDHDAVAVVVAQQRFATSHPLVRWDSLSRRAKLRLTHGAKRWLNRVAVEHMTAALLAERDPAGELIGCLQAIASLAGSV